jgi:hypothetical protein
MERLVTPREQDRHQFFTSKQARVHTMRRTTRGITLLVTLLLCSPDLCIAGSVTGAEAAFFTGREAIANTIVGIFLKEGAVTDTTLMAVGTAGPDSWTLGLSGSLDNSPFNLNINVTYDQSRSVSSFLATGNLGLDHITSSGSAVFSPDNIFEYSQFIIISDPWYEWLHPVAVGIEVGVAIYDFFFSKNGDPPRKTEVKEDLNGYQSKDLDTPGGLHIQIKGGQPGSAIHQEIKVTGVPEPSSLILLGIGALAPCSDIHSGLP